MDTVLLYYIPVLDTCSSSPRDCVSGLATLSFFYVKKKDLLWRVVRFELATQNPCSAVDAIPFAKALVRWDTGNKLTNQVRTGYTG